MKRILIILTTIPLFFGSCEKEEEDNNNNNNNSSLSLEQTIWELHSYSWTLFSDDGQVLTYGPYNVPNTDDILSQVYGGGTEYVTWTFFEDNGMFIQDTKLNNHSLISDTNIYSYYSGLNRIISEDGNYLNGYNFHSYSQNGLGYIDIIQFSNNILSCQILGTTDEGNYEWNLEFSKVQ